MIDSIDSNQPFFTGYQHPLKTLFKKGKMPSVKRGLYRIPITPDNVSLEHLKPHSRGGRTIEGNLALADKHTNTARGTRPLADFLTWDMLEDYLSQFNFRIKNVFDGYKYQEKIRKTCEELGVVNPARNKIPTAQDAMDILEQLPKKIQRSIRNKAKKNHIDYMG